MHVGAETYLYVYSLVNDRSLSETNFKQWYWNLIANAKWILQSGQSIHISILVTKKKFRQSYETKKNRISEKLGGFPFQRDEQLRFFTSVHVIYLLWKHLFF